MRESEYVWFGKRTCCTISIPLVLKNDKYESNKMDENDVVLEGINSYSKVVQKYVTIERTVNDQQFDQPINPGYQTFATVIFGHLKRFTSYANFLSCCLYVRLSFCSSTLVFASLCQWNSLTMPLVSGMRVISKQRTGMTLRMIENLRNLFCFLFFDCLWMLIISGYIICR